MEKYYDIAGQIVKIIGADTEMYTEERSLANFCCENKKFDREIYYELVEKLSQPVGECIYADSGKMIFQNNATMIRYIGSVEKNISGAYLRIERKDTLSRVEVLKQATFEHITAKIVMNTLEAEHFIAQNQGFILHASYIVHDGKAILFTAPSGTGKSTQADLWEKLRNAEIINGDRAVIRMEETGFYALGIPYAGSSGIAKYVKKPLAAVVYLSQSPETRVRRLSGQRAFRSVWEGISVNIWDSEDVSKVSNTLIQLLAQIPIFHLACTPDITAVQALENALKSEIL